MIVLKFIIGVLVVAIPLAIIYRLGKWSTKDELYVDTAEVFLRGFITIVLCVLAIALLLLTYMLGDIIIDKLI